MPVGLGGSRSKSPIRILFFWPIPFLKLLMGARHDLGKDHIRFPCFSVSNVLRITFDPVGAHSKTREEHLEGSPRSKG